MDATDAQIKHAFRKLALQFHPDKNPSPEAESIIKEVNEAYEVLGDPLRKVIYDQMLRGVVEKEQTELQPKHRDPRYRPQPKTATTRRPSKRDELLALMAAHLKYAQFATQVGLIFSIVMITDYLWPVKKQEVKIVGYHIVQGPYVHDYKLELDNGVRVNLTKEDAKRFSNSFVLLHRSVWLKVPMSIEDPQTNYTTRIDVSIFGNFIFGPCILLSTSLIGFFLVKGVELRFNLGVVNFLLTLLNLVFLQIHKF